MSPWSSDWVWVSNHTLESIRFTILILLKTRIRLHHRFYSPEIEYSLARSMNPELIISVLLKYKIHLPSKPLQCVLPTQQPSICGTQTNKYALKYNSTSSAASYHNHRIPIKIVAISHDTSNWPGRLVHDRFKTATECYNSNKNTGNKKKKKYVVAAAATADGTFRQQKNCMANAFTENSPANCSPWHPNSSSSKSNSNRYRQSFSILNMFYGTLKM